MPPRPFRLLPLTVIDDATVEVLIRPFRPEDLDGLFVLDFRSYAPAYRFGYQQLLLTLQQREVTALVIEGERKGDVIGGLIVRAEPEAGRGFVVSLMVDPDFRRLGLGTRLLRWTLEYARTSGWGAVVVAVEHENPSAAAFLAANEFVDSGQGQPYFSDADTGTLWRSATGKEASGKEASGDEATGESTGESGANVGEESES